MHSSWSVKNRAVPLNERGAVLYIFAAMIIVFLGLAAMAIDTGVWYVARSEAQRAAEAGAHAGASIFLYAAADEPGARAEAETFAELNSVRGVTPDVLPIPDIDVLVDSQKVRVRVQRSVARGNPLGTMFAKAMGINTVDIGAVAPAQVWPGDGTDCVLPFAIPDLWRILDPDPAAPDPGWTPDPYSIDFYPGYDGVFDPGRGDYYQAAAGAGMGDNYTGYGTKKIGWVTKLTSSSPSETPQPGWYYPIRLPGSSGGADYRESIANCWSPEGEDNTFEVGDDVIKDPGNMIGPTRQGFLDILNDPLEKGIVWDNLKGCPVKAGSCVGAESRRVRPLILFDPMTWPDIDNGAKPVKITGFGGIFIERREPPGDVWVRWMQFATISPAAEWGESSESLLRVLRIVE